MAASYALFSDFMFDFATIRCTNHVGQGVLPRIVWGLVGINMHDANFHGNTNYRLIL